MAEQADVTDRASMRKAVAHVIDRFRRLDIAFINAGIGGGPGFLDMGGKRNPAGAVENLDDKFWYGHVTSNLTSVFVSLKSVVPIMRAQQSGSIIVTTSVAALKTENFVCTAYLTAKAGAAHLVRQVALGAGALQYPRQRHGARLVLDRYRRRPHGGPGRCKSASPPPIRWAAWRSPTR